MVHRILVLALFLTASSKGGELAWRSNISFGTANETSQGGILTSEWTFHLGYFQNNFVPTASNTSEWCSRWRTLDVSSYSEFQNRFASVWDDDGSVPAGTEGYIWGFNRGSQTPEWILIGASNWTWPLVSANPLDPNSGAEWLVDDANEIVLGQVNQNGIHMTTASATGLPPLLEGDQWLEFHFTAAEQSNLLVSGWDADPDQDGLDNLTEFAFGTNPRTSNPLNVFESFAGGFFEFSIQKAQKVAVTYEGEVSSNLISWQSGEAEVILLEESATSLTYRDLQPLSSGPRFGRVRVSLQP